mgnify:CR=1 FL=1
MEEFKFVTRRQFLKQSIALGAIVTLGTYSNNIQAGPKQIKLTILHTNDVHSRIEPFPMDGSRNQGLGGVARRSTLIQKIRQEQQNVLLLDSGDMFQGTPYFNLFGGQLELELMSKLGYDAGTFGNHEFDNGLDGIMKHFDRANFPFLTANYDFSDTILAGKTKDYIVIKRGGLRIGITGIGVNIEGLVDPNSFKGMRYVDPIPVVNNISKILKEKEKCDLIICLSHLGYEYGDDQISDLKLAANIRNVDIILGGHTHTFLDKPTIIKDLDNKDVYINQVGFAGIRLGRLDIIFDKSKDSKKVIAQHYTIGKELDQIVAT